MTVMQIAAALPEGCQLSLIDEHAYQLCRSETWCSDLVSQFPDYDSFRRLGLGVVVLKNGAVVSGASSYTRYRNGIEIEVDGRKVDAFAMPADWNRRRHEIWWRFDLKTGRHTITIHWTNPRDDAALYVRDALLLRKK